MDSNGYPDYSGGESGYVPGYGQAPQEGYTDYSGAGYQDAGAGGYQPQDAQDGYTDFSAQSAYGEEYVQPQASASSSSSLDNEWINNILGVDESGQTYDGGEQSYGYVPSSEHSQQEVPNAEQRAQYTNPGQTSYRPSGSGPNNNGRPSGSAPRTSASGGNGGNGGKRKMKLNRNGYMFIAFLAILLICIIIVIALIARGCSKKTKPTETTAPSIVTEQSTVETTAPSTQATLPDASAPIGYFCFSDDIGYRTWWDVFHYVYNIDIENARDPRIAIIITYNKLDPATYTGPNSGDRLLLPPRGVLTGEIDVTWNAGSGTVDETAPAETTSADEITSNIHIT